MHLKDTQMAQTPNIWYQNVDIYLYVVAKSCWIWSNSQAHVNKGFDTYIPPVLFKHIA
jgi:hypothetical protein